ncbi:MAG: terminase small subunit [Alphaproteobacteria bacterium]|nr:terminase small subunit [Alphaproteobacteria bacterium]
MTVSEAVSDVDLALDIPVTDGLTARQQRFVEEYVVTGNAAESARRAGYSLRSADDIGGQLLRKPRVREAVDTRRRAISARTGVTAERVELEIARVAFASLGDLAEWGPDGVRLKPSAALSEDDVRAVLEVSQGKGGLKLKLGKMQALALLARRTGLDRVDDSGAQGGPAAITSEPMTAEEWEKRYGAGQAGT